MLEGVLKACHSPAALYLLSGFNPWYVGGGVKSFLRLRASSRTSGFNPWYVGGGVKSPMIATMIATMIASFNPWYVGGGVKR